jgi:hypothetical protein
MRAARALVVVLCAAVSGPGLAATAYKCVDAHGAITFQDRPCRAGTEQHKIELPEPAPVPPQPEASPPPPPEPPPPMVADESLEPVRIPPPAFYLCTRYDGTQYISDTGEGGSALVPLGVLGVPGRSLADAYSPQHSIGVSAPGLRQIPHVPARSVPFGGMSTWIDDECHEAAPREACAYLKQSLDDVRYKLRKAFSDTTPDLKRQEADILERLRGC